MNTDLKGIVALQKNYLDILSDKTNDPALTTKTGALQDELSKAHKAFKDADVSSSQVLTDQEKVQSIINTEKDRLLLKKQSIDNALSGKKREIELNDSYQKKQSEYNKIKIAWIFALAIYVLITVLKNHFPVIPSFVNDLILIGTFVTVSIYSINIFIEISRREKINFNKLNLAPPTIVQTVAKKDSGRESDLLKGMNLYGCVSSYCCSEGTKWDSDMSKCVHDPTYDPNKIKDETSAETSAETTSETTTETTSETTAPEQFTTLLGNIGLNKRRINIDIVKENYANEYENYSRL
jgi:hypothetical protein